MGGVEVNFQFSVSGGHRQKDCLVVYLVWRVILFIFSSIMSERNILGTISYILGIIIIVVFLLFTFLSLLIPVSGFIRVYMRDNAPKIAKEKAESCEEDGGAYFPYESRCVFYKDPPAVASVCQEWDRKNSEHKEKIEKSVEYFNSIITEEQKLIIDLWSTVFNDQVFYYEDGRWAGLPSNGETSTYSTYAGDSGYFKKHIIPVWIEKEERTTAEGEKYVGFHISYSVRMGDWYRHEVGNFTKWAGANWVIIKESDYKSLIEILTVTADKSRLLKISSNPLSAYDEFSEESVLWKGTNWEGEFWSREFAGPTNVAEFRNFSGIVIAQKHAILEQGRDCGEMISLLRNCDPHLKITNWDNRYTAEGINFNGNSGISISARSGYEENRIKDCHNAELNMVTNKLSCYPVDCDPYGGRTWSDFTM